MLCEHLLLPIWLVSYLCQKLNTIARAGIAVLGRPSIASHFFAGPFSWALKAT
jgi:hypothetical protein